MKQLFILFSVFAGIQSSFSQTVCGVINTYYKVTGIDTCNNVLTVSAKGLHKADRVVIMQMNGATVQLGNNSAFGTISNISTAGNYEFNVIGDVVNDTQITFVLKFLNMYDPTKALQIIHFPAYKSVTTNCTVTCPPWNGETGGVLVLFATDTIRVQSRIDVNGKGFQGSAPMNAGNCLPLPYLDYYTTATSNLAGRKGEGIAVLTKAYECGRGKAANAGGGGNEHNSGGAGGGNYGAGGNGGERIKNPLSCPGNFPGIGGQDLSSFYSNLLRNKIFMGGSGGVGHENNNFSAYSGNGGGVVFLVAKVIRCPNNDSVLAQGKSVAEYGVEDGGSGAGAGGVVILKTDTVIGKIFVSVKGGFGQSVDNSAKNECYGPGGGGGGGMVGASFKKKMSTVVVDTAGGVSGLVYNSTGSCNNSANGATDGAPGKTFYNYIYNENPVIFRKFSMTAGNDLTICKGDSVQLNANRGLTFEWTPNYKLSHANIKNPIAKPDTTTTYIVKAYDSCSYAYDTVTVNVLQPPVLLRSPDTSICYGDTLQLFATGGLSYSWLPPISISDLDIDSPKVWPTTSMYYVVKAMLGACSKTDTIRINVVQAPVLKISNDTIVCPDDKLTLHVSGAARYAWSPNTNISDTTSADPEITAKADITYFVTGYNATGCYNETKVTIRVHPSCEDTISTRITIPNVFTPDGDELNDVFELNVRNVTGFSVLIFNRWGQKVFESADMHFKWDGDNLPGGVYFFKINYTNSDQKQVENKGTVTLIR